MVVLLGLGGGFLQGCALGNSQSVTWEQRAPASQPQTSKVIGGARVSGASASEGFAIVGDAGVWNPHTRQVRDSIQRAGLKRLVMPGDNLYNRFSTYEQEWSPWKQAGFIFEAVAIGNHNAGFGAETAYFNMPGQAYAQVISDQVRFIMLNSDSKESVSEQAEWFQQQLESAREPFVFVMFHHPIVTLSSMHDWTERQGFQTRVRPLLYRYREKITALIVGHDHFAGLYSVGELPVILSGATHEMREPEVRNGEQAGLSVVTQYMYSGSPTWVKLTLPNGRELGSNVMVADFIRATDDHVDCSVQLVTGKAARPAAHCKNR